MVPIRTERVLFLSIVMNTDSKSLSEKGSDPLEASLFLTSFSASPERVRPLFG